ncbi:MAG: hypothetical protein WD738_13565 [Pirellulales bacterium]
MTATRKLFIAAAILAAGFGVAKLLGTPAPRLHAPESQGVVLTKRSTASQTSHAPPASPHSNSPVRLVPDFEAVNAGKSALDPLVDVAPPLLSSPATQPLESPITREMYGLESAAPRAKLRNEAPRPLAIDSRAPTTLERPVIDQFTADSSSNSPPPPPRSDWPTGGSRQAGFETAAVSTPAITASYNETLDQATDGPPITPPPWPAPVESEGPRRHIIVDGDSLARLAGRYLHDPRRSGEIFEANRAMLADPELLPIGAELVIPSRTSMPAIGSGPPQSCAPRAVAIHAAASGGLVPVRPVPSTEGIVPRAQLSRPLPAE